MVESMRHHSLVKRGWEGGKVPEGKGAAKKIREKSLRK